MDNANCSIEESLRINHICIIFNHLNNIKNAVRIWKTDDTDKILIDFVKQETGQEIKMSLSGMRTFVYENMPMLQQYIDEGKSRGEYLIARGFVSASDYKENHIYQKLNDIKGDDKAFRGFHDDNYLYPDGNIIPVNNKIFLDSDKKGKLTATTSIITKFNFQLPIYQNLTHFYTKDMAMENDLDFTGARNLSHVKIIANRSRYNISINFTDCTMLDTVYIGSLLSNVCFNNCINLTNVTIDNDNSALNHFGYSRSSAPAANQISCINLRDSLRLNSINLKCSSVNNIYVGFINEIPIDNMKISARTPWLMVCNGDKSTSVSILSLIENDPRIIWEQAWKRIK